MGVSLYIANEVEFKVRTDLKTTNEEAVELLFIEIEMRNMKNIIVGLNRPPENKFEEVNNVIDTMLSKVDKENKLLSNGRLLHRPS